LAIKSEIELRELPNAQFSENFDIEFETSDAAREVSSPQFQIVWADADRTIAVYRALTGLEVQFPKLASFIICEHSRKIIGIPHSDLGESGLAHLLLDQVLPRVIAHNGRIALHGGSVIANSTAI